MEVVFWWKLSSDGSCLLMKVVQWWKLSYDERYNSQRSDESCLLMSVLYWWKLYIDEVCLLMKVVFLMKVVYWWELSIDESYLLMNVVYWWKLSSDGSCLLMKVIIVKEVISCDVSPVAMFLFLHKPCGLLHSVCCFTHSNQLLGPKNRDLCYYVAKCIRHNLRIFSKNLVRVNKMTNVR